MSPTTTSPTIPDLDRAVAASVLDTLTAHLAMDRGQVEGCLAGAGDDLRITSRVAIVVIARAQKALGVTGLVDPKKLPPEQITSVRSVADLLIARLSERSG